VVGEELTLRRWDGKSRVVEVNSVPIVRNGVAELAVATFFDVTELRRNAELIAANNALLRLVASGAPLARVLEDLVLMLERHAGGELLGSVLLLDRDGVHLRHGAAPSLPQAYNEAIDGIEIGPSVGSCGTAAFRREAVTVSDIEHDPLWADFRDLALEHGLRACWSTPIFSREGEVLGTFAMYHRERAEPRDEHLVLVEIATRTAALAIEQRRLQDESERSFFVVEQLNRVGEAINATLDLQDVVQVVTDAATELTGADFGAFFYNVIREDGEAYTLYTLSGVPRAAFERFPMPRNTKIFDPTFKGTAVVRIADVKQDPRYGRNPPYHGMPEGHLPVTSYLAAPVKNIAGDVLGGLFFGHKDAGVFTEEHERLVVGIAAQAAVAIERAHLFVSEQNARAEAERRAQAALSLEHVSDGVCLVDGDGVVRVWNPAAARITGAPASRVVGGPLAECFPAFETVADHETTIRVRSGGRDLWLAVAATPFADGVVYTFRDRTSEHRLEEMRTEIVATVSHELRTPLAAVYGAAQTLARPEVTSDDAAREKLLQMIVDETQRLTRVADQILTTSDLEQREADEPLADVDVSNLLAQVAELGAGRGEVALTVTADPGLRARAGADKLRQVLTNLLDNAVKYGGAGGRVELRARAHGADRVRLSVADWGPGVPPGEATRVFDRFYRLDPDQRSGVAGTGLGLYICRELVRRMDGDIWVEPTRPDCGATFVIDLAAAPAT
jgi:PAS domain S-box-containing protein